MLFKLFFSLEILFIEARIMNDTVGLLALSRYGDIINALPIAKYLSNRSKVDFIVAEEYKDILEGVSYVNPVPVPGLPHFQHTPYAMEWASQKYKTLVNAQVCNNPNHSQTRLRNFCEEQYYLAGFHWMYGKEDPVFDRRNKQREEAWLSKFDLTKPIVAYNLLGYSSPIDGADLLERAIISRFGDYCTLVNTSKHKCERLFDLLGLLDICKVFITIDTSTLHLAKASNCNTIEIASPTGSWYIAPPSKRCLMKVKAEEVLPKIETILSKIADCIKGNVVSKPSIRHVVSVYDSKDDDDKRRAAVAKSTWNVLYSKGVIPVHVRDSDLKRSSRSIGDSRRLPFIRDLINYACKDAISSDVIIITNNDTCIVDTVLDDISEQISKFGCACANRRDFDRLEGPIAREEVKNGKWYCGLDFFAFTKEWWETWSFKYPDMILGCEAWDQMMNYLMQMSIGGDPNDYRYVVKDIIYHEKHDSFWERPGVRNYNAGQKWARKLAYDWISKWRTAKEAADHYPECAFTEVVYLQPNDQINKEAINNVAQGLSKEIKSSGIEVAVAPHPRSPQPQAATPPPHIVSLQNPVPRATKLKAKVNHPDGTRVHLFTQ